MALCAALGQALVGAPRHPLRAERQSFDFGAGKHQRRQQEAGLQHIAEAGFAFDLRAHGLKRGDVAVERAQGDARLARQFRPAHRLAVAAERLQQIQQAVRA